MKKRLLLPFSLLCLAGMIVACGQQGSSSNQQSSGPDSSTIPSSEPVPSSTSSSESQGGNSSSSDSQLPPAPSSETPVNYTLEITNKANLAEEWFASDGNRTVALLSSPGVVRQVIGKEIFVESSDPSIVKVENNQVLVPVAPGKVTITAIYHNAYASCRVEVKGMTRPATIEQIAKDVAAGKITSSDKPVELFGTVTGIYGNTSIIQEGDYAMYVYNKNYDGVKVGDRAHLISTYTLYNGLVETSAVTIYEKSNKQAEEIKAKDIPAAEFKDLTKEDASRLINVSGIYSLGESLSKGGCAAQASSSAYRLSSVKIGDVETYIFVNKYLEQSVLDAINAKLNQAEADSMKIEVKGGHVYTNTSYMDKMAISITSADQLTLSESDIVTLPTKVELEGALSEISVEDGFKLTPKFTPSNTNRKGLTYNSSNENVASVSAEGLVVGKAVGEATITATSSVEGCENVKASINVKVKKAEFVTQPVDGETYYFGLSQQNLGKKIYLNGEMDGYYFKTVEDKASAVGVKVEKQTGADNKFALKAGEKYLKIEVGGAYVNTVLSNDPFYLTWDATKCSFFDTVTTCTNNKKNGDCYLGTSGTYTTVSAANNQKFFAHLYPSADEPVVPTVEYVSVGALSFNKDTTLVIDNKLSEEVDPRMVYTATSGVAIEVRKGTSTSNVNVWQATYSSVRWYVGHKVTFSNEKAFNRIVLTCDASYETFKPEDEGTTIKAFKEAGIAVSYDADAKQIIIDLPAAVKSFDLVPDKQIRPSNVELLEGKGGEPAPVEVVSVGALSFNKDETLVIDNKLSEEVDPKMAYTATSGVSIEVRKGTSSSNVNVWQATYSSVRWYVGHKVTFNNEKAFNRIVLTCDSNYETFKPEDEGTTIKAFKEAGIAVSYDADAKQITIDLPAAVKSFDLVPDKQIRPSNVELFEVKGGEPAPAELISVGALSFNKDETLVIDNKLSEEVDPKMGYTATSGVSIEVRKGTSTSNVNVWQATYSSVRWYIGQKITFNNEKPFSKIVLTCDSNYETFKPEDEGTTIKALKEAGIAVSYDADAKQIIIELPGAVKSFDLVPDKQIRPSNVELFGVDGAEVTPVDQPKEYASIGALSFNKDETLVIDNKLSEEADPKMGYAATSGISIDVRKGTSTSNVNVWQATYSSVRWYIGQKITFKCDTAFDKIVLTCDSNYETFKAEDEGTTIKELKAAGIKVSYDADAKQIIIELPSKVTSFDLVPDKQVRPSNVELFASK